MFKKLILLAVLLLVSVPAFAQRADTSWVRRYGTGADANALAVDGSGNVYVTGKAGGSYVTIKYYPDGDTAWLRSFDREGNEEAYAIAVDDSGYVYVTGEIGVGGNPTAYGTIKYEPDGDTVWVREYSEGTNNRAVAIAVDGSYNVYVTGVSDSMGTSNHNQDYATVKYSPSGTQLWVARYNGPGSFHDLAYAITVDDSNYVYVTGWSARSYSAPFNYDYATIKYDSDGDTVWVRRYSRSGSYSDHAYAIAVDNSYNVYVTGYSHSSSTQNDYATIKYDSDGDSIWAKIYNGPGNDDDQANALTLDGSGNILVTGYSIGSGTYEDFATIKYDADGDTAWLRRYDDATYGYGDLAQDIVTDVYNNVYVTGWSAQQNSDTFNYDYVTMKYNASGQQSWVKKYNGPADYNDQTCAIAVDTFNNAVGNVYVTGQSGGTPNFEWATIKYFQSYCGDVDCDSLVVINDVVYIINYLFKDGPAPCPVLIAGDVNCSGDVTVVDAVYLTNYVFSGGPAPCDPDGDGQEECQRP